VGISEAKHHTTHSTLNAGKAIDRDRRNKIIYYEEEKTTIYLGLLNIILECVCELRRRTACVEPFL
jgi:hypothetical protein